MRQRIRPELTVRLSLEEGSDPFRQLVRTLDDRIGLLCISESIGSMDKRDTGTSGGLFVAGGITDIYSLPDLISFHDQFYIFGFGKAGPA